MRRVSLVGVLVGGITDIATTNIAAVPLVLAEAVYLRMRAPELDQTKALLSALHTDPVMRASILVVGGLCSILGGYVAARIAKRAELLNGALSSVLGAGLSILAIVTGRSHEPLAQSILAIAVSPVLGAIGGYVCIRRSSRRSAAPPIGTVLPG